MREEYKLETSIGPCWITPTQANHIHVENGRNSLNADRTLPHVHAPFVIRGVEITVSGHFYKWADGSWHLGLESGTEYERRRSLYLSRLMSAKLDDVSESARKKIESVLTPLIQEWASKNQQAIHAAEVDHLEMELESAQRDYDKAKSALLDAETKLTQIKSALEKAR